MKQGSVRSVVVVCLGLFWSIAAPAEAQMQRLLGVDAHGFGQPVPAFSVTVPQGWKGQGGVIWGNHDPCNSYGYDLSWGAQSPDGLYGVAVLPSMRWSTVPAQPPLPSCANLSIGSARDAISQMMGKMVPNAQMLDYRPRPDFLQEMRMSNRQMDLGGGAAMRFHVDAGEALFGFSAPDGRAMRVTLGLVVQVVETYLPGGGVMPDMRNFQGTTLPAWLAFAPDGQLDLGMSEQMRTSIQINPQWAQRIQQHRAKIDGSNRRSNAKIAQINREASQDISRMNQESFERRMRSMDESARAFNNAITEREDWRDTDGSRLNAPTGGENMWRLDNGDYVSTDDYNFNPLQETGQFGTQLQRWD